MKTKVLFFSMLMNHLSYAQFAAVPTLKDKLGAPILSLEIKPRYTNQWQFYLDTTVALVWNF